MKSKQQTETLYILCPVLPSKYALYYFCCCDKHNIVIKVNTPNIRIHIHQYQFKHFVLCKVSKMMTDEGYFKYSNPWGGRKHVRLSTSFLLLNILISVHIIRKVNLIFHRYPFKSMNYQRIYYSLSIAVFKINCWYKNSLKPEPMKSWISLNWLLVWPGIGRFPHIYNGSTV